MARLARHLYAHRSVAAGVIDSTTPIDSSARSRLAVVQRWTLRAGLFLLPLAYAPTMYDRWVLPKLLLARLLVLILVGLWLARAIQAGAIVIKRSPLDVPWLVFLASALISSVLALNANVAVFGTYSRYDGLLTLLTYAALYWLAVQSLDGPGQARSLLRTLLASAYVVAGIAIVQTVADSLQPNVSVHAYGTLGQWNVLGAFIAIALPIGLWELAAAKSTTARVLALNVCAVIGAALLLTFSRSAWLGAALGIAVLISGHAWWRSRRSLAIATFAAAAVAAIIVALALAGGSWFEGAVSARASSIVQPSEWGPRPLIWRDSLPLIASRPVFGYGPDTFGLAYPRFDTVYFHEPIDKAHAEVLQVAATQGLVGVAAYALLLVAFARAFWRGRTSPGAFAMLGAFVAYQATLQVNFTALGSAFPYWIFMAAAMHQLHAVTATSPIRISAPARTVSRVGIAALIPLAAAGVVLPCISDASLLVAVQADAAGHPDQAKQPAALARALQPQESVYAVEVANIAFEQGDWSTARAEYTDAARLGTYNPLVFRNLAFADRNLGLMSEARAAARSAYELNRFDPANQAVLAQFEGTGA